MAGKKRPKAAWQPPEGQGKKAPKALPQVTSGSTRDVQPVFSFTHADRSHAGGWCWPDADHSQALLEFMCDMGRLTWGEIQQQETGGRHRRHKKHHSQAFDEVCTEAAERLRDLRLDEVFEEFFRFRLSGEQRLWGFREQEVFHVLWWDSEHAVCPSEKRNT